MAGPYETSGLMIRRGRRGRLAATAALVLLPSMAVAHPWHPAQIRHAAPLRRMAPAVRVVTVRVPVRAGALPVAAPAELGASDSAARQLAVRQIALTQALPRQLRGQRLQVLADAATDPAARLAYAQALVAYGAPGAARVALAGLDSAAGLTVAERQRAAFLQAGLPALPTSTLALAPGLALAAPVAPVAAPPAYADPAGTLAFSQTVLQRDPSNQQARQDAVRAALQLNDPTLARQLADAAVANDPNDPAGWMLSASVAQQSQDSRLALLDLKRARDLRDQQLGSDTGAGMPDVADPTQGVPPAQPVQSTDLAPLAAGDNGGGGGGGGDPASGPAQAVGGYQTAQTFYTNPFRNQPQPGAESDTDSSTPASNDPMTRQIDSTLATLQAQVAPQVMGYLDFTGRSGDSGLAGLSSVGLPMEATFSPNGYGKLKFLVHPVWLFAGRGSDSPFEQANFGTDAFNVFKTSKTTVGYASPGIDYQSATGVGLDVDYAYSWLEADLGSTPLGFNQENVVGGITLTPKLSDDFGFRLIAERRAVTDSLLSYAGTRDPRTGNDMGGVIRNRLYGQAEWTWGTGFWFAGAGVSRLIGENVKANTEVEAQAGLSYPVWRTKIDEVRVGFNAVYFGFNKNLDFFTLGQGGYFSPQSYFAALIPVSYSERLGRLSYMVSGSIGVQTYHQNSSPFFPTNPALQAALENYASGIAGLNTSYASQNELGPSGSAHGEVQYDVTRNFGVGGAATFERAGNFDQGEGLIYARYIFDGVR